MSKRNAGQIIQQNIIGTVKWFNNAKGYGFISIQSDTETDLFAHYSAIEMNGYKYLKPGQNVSFSIAQGPKGWHAVNITTVEADK